MSVSDGSKERARGIAHSRGWREADEHDATERGAAPEPRRSDVNSIGASTAAASAAADDRIQRLVRERIDIVAYDPAWPESFQRERDHLLACLPNELIRRIEHFGSTAVPGLAAKPIIDILVEVSDLQATRARIAPILAAQDYEYFWRPTHGDDMLPHFNGASPALVERDGGTMPLYLSKFSYTPETWARLIRSPEDRRKAAQSYIESVGGKLHGFWYAFGAHDGYSLWEAPDNVSMAAVALAIGGGGALSSFETTVLLTVDETMAALRKAEQVQYRQPGA